MADSENRIPESAPGSFYVDDAECVGCGNCSEIAPEVFRSTDSGDTRYVYNQPDPDDRENVQRALEECPMNAIGDDGGDR